LNELETPNMKLTIRLARLVTFAASAVSICACSSSDGDGQSTAELCASFCEKTAGLDCPNDADDCVADCVSRMDEIPQACRTQVESYGSCAVARPASDFECDVYGEASLKDGTCEAELNAIVVCAAGDQSAGGAGGGGGGGGGGGDEECQVPNDGECGEPGFCSPGTDTADREG
jgi:hypothetical protein